MPADLSNSTLSRRVSFIIDEDCLIVLKHEQTRDRIRRVLFDRVDSVTVWRTWPWGRMVLVSVLLGVPAFILLLAQDTIAYVISGILLALALVMLANYAHCRKTHIGITRAGKGGAISVIQRPAKVRRFLQRLQAQIVITQDRAAQGAAEAVQAFPVGAAPSATAAMTPQQTDAPWRQYLQISPKISPGSAD